MMAFNFTHIKNGEIYINTVRHPSAVVGSLEDLLEAYERGDEFAVVSLEPKEAMYALEDGEYLATIDVSDDAIEDVHAMLVEWLMNNGEG